MRTFYIVILALIAISADAMAAVVFTSPQGNELQSGFIQMSVVFDSGDVVLLTIDGNIISEYSCNTSPCNYYFDSVGLENGQHQIGAIAYDGSMNQLESSDIQVNIENNRPPDSIAEIQGTAIVLVPEAQSVDASGKFVLWLLYFPDIANNKILTYDIDYTIIVDDGIKLSPDNPTTFRKRAAMPQWTSIEIADISDGQHELRVVGTGKSVHSIYSNEDESTITVSASVKITSENGLITVE